MELDDDVHKDVFRRAIDDGYDFNSVARVITVSSFEGSTDG
jgi:hypothetical protein